jgi:hypothetical protein
MAFVPITTPIKATKPSDTAPRIMPREELSAAAATTIGIVAFNDGDALRFVNKLGPGVPEKLILLKDGEKLPNTDIDIERVWEIDKEFDILFVSDKDGLAVLPGEGETVLLAALDIVSDDDNDLVCVMLELKEIEELTVCDTLAVNDDDILGDDDNDLVCVMLELKEIEELTVCDTLAVNDDDILGDDDNDLVCVMLELKEIEELTVCDTLAVNDDDILGDEVLDSVCEALDVKDGEMLAVCVMDGVTEAIIHV